MKLSRRDFLKLSAATAGVAATAGLTGCERDVNLTALSAEAEQIVEASWYASTCEGCTTWCPVEVKVLDGRAIDIRGNQHSKAHRGNVCTKAQQSIMQVYDPDRIKVPMKRTNPNKGRDEDPEFVAISWDEAIDEITDQIIELKENDETYKSAIFRGRYTQLRGILHGNFADLIGTPNTISHSAICAESEKMGTYYTESLWGYNDIDFRNSKYVLLWGGDPISTNRMTPHATNIWSDVMDNATIATVDPRYSATANKSDEWLPVIPQEDDALALAMAHVILTEGLWSKEFVGDFVDGENKFITGEEVAEADFAEKHTNGVVKWWNIALKDKTPEWAEQKAGVGAEQIRRVAKEFGAAAPQAVSWVCPGPTMNPRGSYTGMAIHALNGLVGSVDVEGGTKQASGVPTNSFPSIDGYVSAKAKKASGMQKIDQRGYKNFAALKKGKSGGGVVTGNVAQAILDEDPYELKFAIGYWNNFNFSNGDTNKWDKALAKLDFFVHIVTNPAEMTHYADIVLPATHHMYERWGYMTSKADLHSYATLNQPVIDRLWDVKTDESEVVWLIAEKMAEKGYGDMFEYYKNEYKDPETGKKPTDGLEFSEYATKIATQPMWDPAIETDGDQINGWDEFKEVGVYNAPKFDDHKAMWDNFGTVTAKFELYSETMKKALKDHVNKNSLSGIDEALEYTNYLARGEEAFVPHYEESYRVGDEREYPLLFIDYKSRLNREGRSANVSIGYHDIKDADPGDERNSDVARINPEDATRLGIETGDRIKISSPTGEIECDAKVWEGVRPGTVSKAFGQGHWAYGRVASKDYAKQEARGGNNNTILPDEYDRLSGSTARHGGHRVKVEKI